MNKYTVTNFILVALFAVFYQVIIAPRTAIAGTEANMALILTVWIALAFGPEKGAYFGFIAGFLAGALTPIEFGYSCLLLTLTGYFSGLARNKMVVEPLLAKIITLLISIIAYNIFYMFTTFLASFLSFFMVDFSFTLVEIAYMTINSFVVGIIIFILIRYRFLLRKLY